MEKMICKCGKEMIIDDLDIINQKLKLKEVYWTCKNCKFTCVTTCIKNDICKIVWFEE